MRPVDLSTGTPRSIDEFAIEWDRLVVGSKPIDRGAPYLAAIQRFTNNEPPGGIFAQRFQLRADSELERLLSYVQTLSFLQADVVPRVLAGSAARHDLTAFSRDPYDLEAALRAASFSYVSPFLLEGTLAEYLFWYGIYRRFYETRSANEAMQLARGFLVDTVGTSDLETLVPFQSRLPWGAWFDPRSVSDATFAILHRGRRELVVCCFSHSD